MKVTVKLYAGLRQYLPAVVAGTQEVQLDIAEATTPVQLLMQLNVPRDEIHLLLLNGVYVEPQLRNQPIFEDHDTLAVWPAIAGG